ncbi:hypothetical protein DXV76_08320 [Rhodobacteraceae bacterium CCMM004]|nr:hypothetical protein DXV76_08320 [Rhodobacteraceae bacterium CCMM004]
MKDNTDIEEVAKPDLPNDFVFDTEHPVLPIPFTAHIGEYKLDGVGLSVTAAYVSAPGALEPDFAGSRHIVRLAFDFEGFSISLYPEASIAQDKDDEITLKFLDPTGPHLPQLRYILNSFIAGDFVSLGSMLGYTGPVKPKTQKAAADDSKRRMVKRAGSLVLSVALIALAGHAVLNRYLTSYEPRPVFIVRSGDEMRATSGGQITYLDTEASEGEVIYSVSANSGDTLNFMMPCDCDIVLKDGIYEGATILPSDPILTLFDSNVEVRVQAQMSIEGLSKAMNGEQVYLDLADGREVPVRVVQTSATNAAAAKGDLYLPVVLLAKDGALDIDDVGMPARVRLSRSLFGGSLFKLGNGNA